MKLLKKILIPALLLATLFSACKKDDNDNAPGKTSHKVVFKAVGSTGVDLNVVVYGYDTQLTSNSGLSGNTWTSPEINVPASAINAGITIDGIGTSNTSTLKVQIYVDGQLKKEGTSSGPVLAATAQYNF
ncbi:hypothetical protein [Chitinophaga sp.]|uniref:hypothetical protein n=1 Tax=Chitinophaga sp. TaxID=1869181 RepID=UPI002F92D703